MSLLNEIYRLCCEKNFPFAAFKYPGENDYQYLIQLSNLIAIKEDEDITSLKGFAFVPFSNQNNCPSIIIKPDIIKTKRISDKNVVRQLIDSKDLLPEKYPVNDMHIASKEEYTNNVAEIANKIIKGAFKKAILSRIIVEKRPNSVSDTELFLKMCQRNNSSFISLIHIPGYASWIGTTPELLFSHRKRFITLVSLAGTQSKSKFNLSEIEWDEKNRLEQKIVTDYITELFCEFNIDKYQQKGPETVQAGDIVHLKTIFTVDGNKLNGHTGEFIKRLHPTPAVWGQPKTDALNIIAQLEKYNREYYAGYLGPVNLFGRTELYVNLRTMKTDGDNFIIYVGSGITAGSDAQKEWDETCLKAGTLLSVIHNK